MASNELTLEQIHSFLIEKGGKVRNREAVRYFKSYLTDPASKDENRQRFKTFVNKIANTRLEGDEKVLVLKPKYTNTFEPPPSPSFSPSRYPPQYDPRNAIGIPVSPSHSLNDSLSSTSPRQPPPYRPPPPVSASLSSLDTVSLESVSSSSEAPQAPPRERRRDSERSKSVVEETTPKKNSIDMVPSEDDKTVSVKERTQKFNRLASVEDELSPRQPKSAEKENRRPNWGAEEDDSASVIPLEPKKCMEWYVTASRGDYQELLRLANAEPRLVNKKLCLIIGIAGACRRDELRKITTKDIVYQSNMLVITIPDSKNDKRRVFTVTDKLCDGVNPLEIFRQYANLRPKHCNHNIFFVNYKSGKCTVQVVGVHTFAKIPSLIAKYLKLPNELEYTGHCYRRTSATLLVNAGADMLSLKQHGGWKSSTVAEGYIEDSIPNKMNVSKSILTGQALREGSFRNSDAGASASEVASSTQNQNLSLESSSTAGININNCTNCSFNIHLRD